MVRKQIMIGLSMLSLLVGLFFLMNNQFVATGGLVGVGIGSTFGTVAGFGCIVLSGIFYLLRGEEEVEI